MTTQVIMMNRQPTNGFQTVLNNSIVLILFLTTMADAAKTKASAIIVVTAAPTSFILGIKIKFNPMFSNALITVIYINHFSL